MSISSNFAALMTADSWVDPTGAEVTFSTDPFPPFTLYSINPNNLGYSANLDYHLKSSDVSVKIGKLADRNVALITRLTDNPTKDLNGLSFNMNSLLAMCPSSATRVTLGMRVITGVVNDNAPLITGVWDGNIRTVPGVSNTEYYLEFQVDKINIYGATTIYVNGTAVTSLNAKSYSIYVGGHAGNAVLLSKAGTSFGITDMYLIYSESIATPLGPVFVKRGMVKALRDSHTPSSGSGVDILNLPRRGTPSNVPYVSCDPGGALVTVSFDTPVSTEPVLGAAVTLSATKPNGSSAKMMYWVGGIGDVGPIQVNGPSTIPTQLTVPVTKTGGGGDINTVTDLSAVLIQPSSVQ